MTAHNEENYYLRIKPQLMENVEKITSEEFDAKKLAVISGLGARDWFYEMGYKLDGVYVSKSLNH